MKSIAFFSAVCLLAFGGAAMAQPPGPGYGPNYDQATPPARFSVQKGMRFERYRDTDGYHLRIYTQGMDPESIQVSVQGRSLVVQNRESHQVEQRSDRGSYQFATSSSSMRRRFPIPPDADAGAMKRSVEEGLLVITLPYAEGLRY